MSSNRSGLATTPPPVPPRVNEGRMMSGKPMVSATVRASAREWARPLRGTSIPIRAMASLKSLRSSALRMALRSAPIMRTPNLSRIPFSASWMAIFRPVWPPSVGSRASGRLRLDDLLQHGHGDRLDVGGVRHLGVSHDGGGIGVHQDDPEALFPQRLAGLGARVVELARLADDDRPGPDDENRVDVRPLRHGLNLPGRAAADGCASIIWRIARTGTPTRAARGWPRGDTGR